MSNRLWYSNTVPLPTTALSASSEQSANPVSHLRRSLRQQTWRSAVGWTMTEDNRRLDCNRGGGGPGNFTAEIASGTYATPDALAEAVRAALAAADPGVLWEVTYNVAGTDLFRIRDANGAPLNFDLLFTSGANAYRSAHKDLGFSNPDKTGASSYTASLAVYQSRQFIRLSDPENGLAATCFALLQHNLVAGSFNSIEIHAHTSDVWSSPTTVYTSLDPSTDPKYAYFSDPTKSYWRITLNNTQSDVGFTELGILYLGMYVQPTQCIADDLGAQSEPFSTVQDSLSGSRFVNDQPERMRWRIGWKTLDGSARAAIDAYLAGAQVGQPHFFDFDPSTPGELVYVSREAFNWDFVPVQYRDYSTQLVEAL